MLEHRSIYQVQCCIRSFFVLVRLFFFNLSLNVNNMTMVLLTTCMHVATIEPVKFGPIRFVWHSASTSTLTTLD